MCSPRRSQGAPDISQLPFLDVKSDIVFAEAILWSDKIFSMKECGLQITDTIYLLHLYWAVVKLCFVTILGVKVSIFRTQFNISAESGDGVSLRHGGATEPQIFLSFLFWMPNLRLCLLKKLYGLTRYFQRKDIVCKLLTQFISFIFTTMQSACALLTFGY